MKWVVLAAMLDGSCFLGQSSNCGDDYVRNTTHIQDGWYDLVPIEASSGDPLDGVHAVHIEKNVAAQAIVITTDGHRTASYPTALPR